MKSFYLHSALHPFLDPLRLLPGEAGNAITPSITLIYCGGHGTRKDGWRGVGGGALRGLAPGAPRPSLGFVALTSRVPAHPSNL